MVCCPVLTSKNPDSGTEEIAFESSCCSSRGPRSGSQHPHGGTKLSGTMVLGHLVPSLQAPATQLMHRQRTGKIALIHIKIFKK